MLYPDIDKHIEIIIKHKVPIVFTSAGNPKTWTQHLKDHGITVVHVVSSLKFALKAQAAGVDAIVAEGFEAGGHNGRDETTTLCLIPMIARELKIPIIAAGGVGTGRTMLAAMNLGADAVQIGSRFVASNESSAHINFKQSVIDAKEGDTQLTLKELTPVRLIKNEFYQSSYRQAITTTIKKYEIWNLETKQLLFEAKNYYKSHFDGTRFDSGTVPCHQKSTNHYQYNFRINKKGNIQIKQLRGKLRQLAKIKEGTYLFKNGKYVLKE